MATSTWRWRLACGTIPPHGGLLLADLARHIAEAHAQQDADIDAEDFLEQIRSGMEAELDGPTDEISGTVQ